MGRVPPVGVARELLDSLFDRIAGVGIGLLALHHCERQPIHKQYDIRADVGLELAWRLDSELVDRVKAVVLPIAPVDQAGGRAELTGQLVAISESTVLRQRLEGRLIYLQQLAALSGDLREQFVELSVGQPFAPIREPVDPSHGLAEYVLQCDIAKAGAQAAGGVLRDAFPLVDHLPALGGQLIKKGLLYDEVLGHGACVPYGDAVRMAASLTTLTRSM